MTDPTAHFPDIAARPAKEALPGVHLKTFWGDKALISMVTLEPNADVPLHSHMHEQVGVVLEGEVALTVAGETRTLRPGEIYIAPGDVKHSAKAGPAGCRLFEVFSPVREEYKF